MKLKFCTERPVMDDDAPDWPICTTCGREVRTPTGRHLPGYQPAPKI